MSISLNRREFLITAVASTEVLRAQAQTPQTFVAGIVPAPPQSLTAPGGTGQLSAEQRRKRFWLSCDEVSKLGFHRIEIDDTYSRVSETYLKRMPEYRQEMSKRNLTMIGITDFSHTHDRSQLKAIMDEYLMMARFIATAGGGKYMILLISAGPNIGDSTEEEFRRMDMKTLASNVDALGKRIMDETGIRFVYHPLQGEFRVGVAEKLLEMTNDKYCSLVLDLGHVAAAGLDSLDTCKRYLSRTLVVHLKDYRPPQDGSPGKHGNVPLGEGAVDCRGVVKYLRDNKFSGYVLAEAGGTNQHMRDYMVETLGITI